MYRIVKFNGKLCTLNVQIVWICRKIWIRLICWMYNVMKIQWKIVYIKCIDCLEFEFFFLEVKTIENFHWYGKMYINKTHSKTRVQANWATETREIYIREFRVCSRCWYSMIKPLASSRITFRWVWKCSN